MKNNFFTYGMLGMLLVASSCVKKDNEVLPGTPAAKNDPMTLSANPTDQELLRLPDLMVKTPVKKTVTADGDVLLQRDMSYYMNTTVLPRTSTSNDHGHDHNDAGLAASLNRAHPSVKTLQKYFNEAAKEFNVPVELLMAIGQVQSNWTQVGESMYGSWGITGLIENQFVKQITLAAGILKVSPKEIKEDAKTNIRAAAALLAKYQQNKSADKLEDWFDAIKETTGIPEALYKEQLAQRYYDLIAKGSKSVTLWGEIINISPAKVNIINKLKHAENIQQAKGVKSGATTMGSPSSATVSAVDYPGAQENLTTCNYSSRNGNPILYYFVHYVATGTYQNAISWFKNCSSGASAHYVVRNSDGQVTQVVRESNSAWSQGGTWNLKGIATEHEVLASNLSMWYSEPMLTSAGNLARNVCDRRAIPKVRAVAAAGINGHSDVMATQCPNMTQAVWNLFMAHVNPPSSPGVFEAFTSGVGRFNTAPTYSGSTVGIATTSTNTWDSGTASLRVTLNDNTAVTTPWTVRLLSGTGLPANNVLCPKTGTLYFSLRTSTAQPGATVRIWVDDSDGTEVSPPIAIINDGVMHTYSWNLSSYGGTGLNGGNGVITAANVTLDAIVLQQPNTATQWVSFIDNIGK